MPTRTVLGATGLLCLLAALALGACTRALVPLGTTPLPLAPTPEPEQAVEWTLPEGEPTFAVFDVAPNDRLPVRQSAGISGNLVAELPGDLRAIRLTGQSTSLGSSTWVEIHLPSGGTGWVNLWSLTEDVAGESFCRDPRVPALTDSFLTALRQRSGEALAGTISPRRGLVLRHDWWNPEIVISPDQAGNLMQGLDEIAWGTQRGSDAPIVGSFRERWLPDLDPLLAASPQQACNVLLTGESGIPPEWPDEYVHMNFVSYHVPAPAGATRFNWRTWAVGVEYVDGVPFVAILIRYQGDL